MFFLLSVLDSLKDTLIYILLFRQQATLDSVLFP